MAYSYKFSALAQEELENSVEWYNKQLFGLGFEFAEVVYDAADAVARNPEAYPIKKGSLREFVVDRFPFVLVYSFNKTSAAINIVHVFHTSRDPKKRF